MSADGPDAAGTRRWPATATWWVIGLALGFLFVALCAAVQHGSLALHVDRPVARWAVQHRSPAATSAFRFLTFLGSPAFVVAGGVVLAVVAAFRSWTLALAIALVTAARPIASWAVKTAVDRARPDISPLSHPAGTSFPSGHALGAAVFWLGVPAVVVVWAGRRAARVVGVLCAVIVLLVMCSRVYLGVHWPSDVVGGALLGLLLLVPVYALGVPRLNR